MPKLYTINHKKYQKFHTLSQCLCNTQWLTMEKFQLFKTVLSVEAPHLHQWATISTQMSHIFFNESAHFNQWATRYLPMYHHISTNEPPYHCQIQCATVSLPMHHHISTNEPPHFRKWATISLQMNKHISTNELPYVMNHHISINENEQPLLHQWATSSLDSYTVQRRLFAATERDLISEVWRCDSPKKSPELISWKFSEALS